MGRDGWTRGRYQSNFRGGFGRGGFGGYGRGGFRGQSRGRGFSGNRDGNRFNFNNTWHKKPDRDSPGKRLSEDQIGVTQYMSEHKGFNGIIKLRYSDFQVSEINEQGEVAKLTTFAHPELPAEEQVEEDEELLLSKYNVEILPMETWDQINKVSLGTESEAVEIDVTTSSKEERTKIHDAVKKAFGKSIVGSTINTEDKKVMRFEKYKRGVRIDKRVKWMWPAEYVYFIVHKENVDTMEAAVRIAERLRDNMKPSLLGYAGTKDRRAKTSQWFSVRKVDPRHIATACAGLRDVHVGNYSFRATGLKLGMLQGNKFRIALRNVTADDAVIDAACENLKECGFINYYGLQRFGTRVEMPTFDIGLKLLKGNYQEAVEAILSEQRRDGRLLRALRDRPRDYCGALTLVARNTRLLYLHSYQSLVWNRCVSERLQRWGRSPAPGDLVPLAPEQIREETDDEETDDEENLDSSQNDATDKATHKSTGKKTEKPREKPKVPVKVLTQEDVDSEAYTIFDIVMPLPGYMIEYPPNMKDYYETLLTRDGLTLEMKYKNRSYSVSGAYRRVAARAGGVCWRAARYRDPRADLILSDLAEIQGGTLDGIQHDGEYKALLLSFTLPSSCYATMALRELLKVDTSSDSQAAQNNYHKRKLGDDATEDTTDDTKRVKSNSEEDKIVTEDSEEDKKVNENSEEDKIMNENSEEEKLVNENNEDEKEANVKMEEEEEMNENIGEE